MTEHLNDSHNNEDVRLDELEGELSSRYGEDPANHESHAVLGAAATELSEHPVLKGSTDVVEFVPQPSEPESRDFKKFYPLFQDFSKLLGDVSGIDARGQEFFESTQWQTVDKSFKKFVEKYNDGTANIHWTELSPRETDLLIHTMAVIGWRYQALQENKKVHFPEGVIGVETILQSPYVPTAPLKAAYDNPTIEHSGQSHLKNLLQSSLLSAGDTATILKKIYGESDGLDALEPGEDEAVDKLRQRMTDFEFLLFCIDKKPENMTVEAIQKHDALTRKRLDRVLVGFGLSEGFIDRYYRAALPRFMNTEGKKSFYDGSVIKRQLRVIKQTMDAVGPDHIDYSAEHFGLTNLDYHTPETIWRYGALTVDTDWAKAERERLRENDVTVIFVDATGDYNGAFTETVQQFGNPSGKTLLFEVRHPNDFYRRMIMLKKQGIRPSNIVISAHGAPGVTHFGGEDPSLSGFRLVSDPSLAEGENAAVFDLNKVALDIITDDTFMQSDDNNERTIIFDSCSSAKEAEKFSSIAETFVKTAGRKGVKVYGGSDVVYAVGNVGSQDGLQFVAADKRRKNKTKVFELVEKERQGRPNIQEITEQSVDSIRIEKRKDVA